MYCCLLITPSLSVSLYKLLIVLTWSINILSSYEGNDFTSLVNITLKSFLNDIWARPQIGQFFIKQFTMRREPTYCLLCSILPQLAIILPSISSCFYHLLHIHFLWCALTELYFEGQILWAYGAFSKWYHPCNWYFCIYLNQSELGTW